MQSFVVWNDEINERLDAGYFYSLQDIIYTKIKNSKYPIRKMRELASIVTKGESPLWKGDSFLKEGVPFLRGKNIKEGAINFDDVVYISDSAHRRMRRSVLSGNYLLLTMAGTLGDVAFFKKGYPECNINQDIAKIKLTDEFSYEYATVYFQTALAKKQINILSNGGTRSHLNFEQIKSFDVILPPISVQTKIVDIMQSANNQKKQKETEALRLLDSIDDYVITELGIKLPEVEGKMCFLVNSEEVRENRADPYYYQPKFEEVEKAVRKGKYDLVNFATVTTDLKNGVEIRKYADEGYRYLRVTDLGKFGIIDNAPRLVAVEEIPERIKLHDNSFLISRSGSLGLVSVVEEKIKDVILSSHIFKVDLDISKILPAYLEAFFRSTLGQIQFFRNNNGGIVPEISQSALKYLMVVIPPLEIQNKIAEEVKRRISEAERLKAETSKIIEEAKKQVEEMILGIEIVEGGNG
jgi:restriction endonuclease S subunit